MNIFATHNYLKITMYRFFVALTIFSLVIGCTKPPPIKPVIEPEEEGDSTSNDDDTDTTVVSKEKYRYEQVKGMENIKIHYIDGTVDEHLFLGSMFYIKDSTENLEIAPLPFDFPETNIYFLSSNTLVEIANLPATLKSTREFAKRHDEMEGDSPGGTGQSTKFSDYKELKKYIPANEDYEKALQLVTYNDSTIVRKESTSLIYGENIAFQVSSDHVEIWEDYYEPHQEALDKLDVTPYFIDALLYGKRHVIMVESDSSRVAINEVLQDLIDEKGIDQQGENVLEASTILLYYRGGGKETLLRYGAGSVEFKKIIADFNKEYRRTDNAFDYPLSYMAFRLKEPELLSYYISYDYLRRILN